MKRKIIAFLLLTFCLFSVFAPLKVNAQDYEKTLTSENVAVFNVDKGFIVYGKSEHETVPLGGSAKIMTAMLALEYFDGYLDTILTVPAGALRGLEGFSHIWLVWQFSEAVRDTWSPMVKPPRLGGNKRMGVFATRSPFRPNPIGLSAVKLLGIGDEPGLGPVLYVSGADLMDGTPIFDIKPYSPYGDCHMDATGGFTDTAGDFLLKVDFPSQLLQMLPEEKREAAVGVLSHDPRPSYQRKPDRIYGLSFAGFDIRFTVKDDTLTVHEVNKL